MFGSAGLPRCPCICLAMLGETVTWGSTQLRTGPVRHISLLPSHVAVREIWRVEGEGWGRGARDQNWPLSQLTRQLWIQLSQTTTKGSYARTRRLARRYADGAQSRGQRRAPKRKGRGPAQALPLPLPIKKKKNFYNGAARDTNVLWQRGLVMLRVVQKLNNWPRNAAEEQEGFGAGWWEFVRGTGGGQHEAKCVCVICDAMLKETESTPRLTSPVASFSIYVQQQWTE